MVTSATALTITITMPSNETGSGATTSGGIRSQAYYTVGPAEQLPGFGWGLGYWGGEASGAVTTTLKRALLDDTAGTGGSGTSITLTSTTNFPSSGTNFIQVGNEEISYTGISGNDSIVLREQRRLGHSTPASLVTTASSQQSCQTLLCGT